MYFCAEWWLDGFGGRISAACDPGPNLEISRIAPDSSSDLLIGLAEAAANIGYTAFAMRPQSSARRVMRQRESRESRRPIRSRLRNRLFGPTARGGK
jgi:hypothetical protein